MAYFDNAATTYPKPDCVYAFMDEFYRNNGGSAGRGKHKAAQTAKMLIDDTRNSISNLLHCSAKTVVFIPSATLALNIIIQGLIKKGVKNVYITPFEHNAVVRTLNHFEKEGLISVYQLSVSVLLEYEIERIRYQFEERKPDLVVVSHASNVTGLVAPVKEIFDLAKQHDSFTLVDMAQTAGVLDLDVGLETIDFAVFAGHKSLLGPTGIAGFIMKPEINLPTILFGGTGYDSVNLEMPEQLPERYEIGTMNTIGIAGLNASIRWIANNTIEKLHNDEKKKRRKLISLIEGCGYLRTVGNFAGLDYIGIVSCLMDGVSSDSAGDILGRLGILVRTGLHCAPLAHRFIGTYPVGTIRFSISCLTRDEDFHTLENVLDEIGNKL